MPSVLDSLLSRVIAVQNGLQSGEIVREVVVRHPDDILNLQREQLFEGKASNGEDLRPYYSEDLKPSGHFWSVETAGRYAAWKQSLSYPYSAANRNPDAPNLYINGRFHSELEVRFGPDEVAVVGGTGYAEGIMMRYGLDKFGLMAERWNFLFREMGGYNELLEQVKNKLWQ